MGILTAEQIRELREPKTRVVEVPGWGGSVKIRELSRKEVNILRDEMSKTQDQDSFEKKMIQLSFVEPALSAADADFLFTRGDSTIAIESLLSEIMDLSGMTEDALEKAKARFPEPGE